MPRELNIQPTGVSLPTSKGHVLKSDHINLVRLPVSEGGTVF